MKMINNIVMLMLKINRNETDYNAMDFSLWKHIGREFIIKSNFVNWYHCVPQNGSLVDMEMGRFDMNFKHYICIIYLKSLSFHATC